MAMGICIEEVLELGGVNQIAILRERAKGDVISSSTQSGVFARTNVRESYAVWGIDIERLRLRICRGSCSRISY